MSTNHHIQGTELRNFLRYGALIAPCILLVYGQLIQTGTLAQNEFVLRATPEAIIVISLSWLLLGTMTFLTHQPKRWWLRALELLGYYALAAAQSVMVSGFASPFSAFWVLLLVATYVTVGHHGLRLGVMIVIISLSVEALGMYRFAPEQLLLEVLAIISVLTTSLIIVTVYASQQTNHTELADSQARENLERDRVITLINNLTDAVFSTDEKGIIKMYNAAALSLLDTNDRIEGQTIGSLINLETADKKTLDIFEELSRSASIRQRDDLIMPLGDEDHLRIEATFAPVQGGDGMSPDGYMLILRDITKMKSLEEERDEFISVVSHELRTPITIAEGSLSNARLMLERNMTKQIAPTIEEAHQKILFLSKMVNDLSTLSRAERGVADAPELIDLTQLAAQLSQEYTPQAEQKGLAFNLDVHTKQHYVKASRLYLQELLQNFITNAIKYTQAGSVTLSIKSSGSIIYFGVSDTGIGIGKSDQKKIFDRFYRAEDYRTRETSGTGLGLYVSVKLAKKLGCKIDVTSRLNHGSTFSFSLKAAPNK